jgi:hypothetical protein
MINYSEDRIIKMSGISFDRRQSYTPFPGKIPTRLWIKITLGSRHSGWRKIRWEYHGKFCLKAIKEAQRYLRKHDNKNDPKYAHVVSVYEYHRTGVIYMGDLEKGTAFYGYNHAHFDGNQIPRSGNRWSAVFSPGATNCITMNGMYFPVNCLEGKTKAEISRMSLKHRRKHEAI